MKRKLTSEELKRQLLLIASSTISNEIAAFNNEQIVHLKGIYNRELKLSLNAFQKELLKTRKDYELYEEQAGKQSDSLYSKNYNMIREVASCGLECGDEIKALIIAYKKNPKSMLGIANKILR